MLRILVLLPFLAAAPPVSPAHGSSPLSDAELRAVVITLERGMCYGDCPVYQVRITGDGRVSYHGEMFVKSQGNRTLRIPRAEVRNLVADFEKAGYFSIGPDFTYDNCQRNRCKKGYMHDSPSAVTSITIRGKTHRVAHDFGCRCAPPALFDVEAAIDKVSRPTGGWASAEASGQGWKIEVPSFCIYFGESLLKGGAPLLRIVFLLSLLGATDLAGSPSPSAPLSDAELREVVITMYRGMCYGECPVYSVRITVEGRVSYNGGSFVKELGNRTLRIRRADVRKLVGVFEKAKYFDIQRNYTEETCGADETCGYTTDSSSVDTSITLRGKTYEVRHSFGCKCAPEALYDVYAAIDKFGRTKHWVRK